MQIDPTINVARDARILIVDDREDNIAALSRILARAGYAICISITDPAEALAKFSLLQPDLLLLDWYMEPLSGLEFIQALKTKIPAGKMPPILVLTADPNSATRREALAVGASDFLSKPFDPSEVLLRIRNLLRTRFVQCRLQDSHDALEQTLDELRAARGGT